MNNDQYVEAPDALLDGVAAIGSLVGQLLLCALVIGACYVLFLLVRTYVYDPWYLRRWERENVRLAQFAREYRAKHGIEDPPSG